MNHFNINPTILLLIFITMKLTGNITWSWVWVLCPFWISFLLWVGIFIGCFMLERGFLR